MDEGKYSCRNEESLFDKGDQYRSSLEISILLNGPNKNISRFNHQCSKAVRNYKRVD